MNPRIIGSLLLLLSAVAVDGSAQLTVSVQAPLALVGGYTLGPISVEAGVPLRFDLDTLGTFATLQWTFEALVLDEVALLPFVGAGVEVMFSSLARPGWYGLLGFQMSAPQDGVWVFAQLGVWPGFERGLLEGFSIGARLEL